MMTILLVLDIYEKSRSFKSIQTCFLEQFPILLGGPQRPPLEIGLKNCTNLKVNCYLSRL